MPALSDMCNCLCSQRPGCVFSLIRKTSWSWSTTSNLPVLVGLVRFFPEIHTQDVNEVCPTQSQTTVSSSRSRSLASQVYGSAVDRLPASFIQAYERFLSKSSDTSGAFDLILALEAFHP